MIIVNQHNVHIRTVNVRLCNDYVLITLTIYITPPFNDVSITQTLS
jgi:hypothetical protein